MARSFLGGEFAGGESAWWRGDWIPLEKQQFDGNQIKHLPFFILSLFERKICSFPLLDYK